MTKLTDKQKKKIIADFVETQNYSETGRLNSVSDVTVRNVINEDKSVLKKLEEKKEENTRDMINYLKSKNENKKRVIDLCFKALEDKLATPDMFTNVKDIVTVYGIIVDKDLKIKELEKNNAINNEITKIDELLDEIKKQANK